MIEEFRLEKTEPWPKDFLGQDIHIGSEVVYTEIGYRNFKRGVVKRITAKCVQIGHPQGQTDSVDKQFFEQVIVVADRFGDLTPPPF